MTYPGLSLCVCFICFVAFTIKIKQAKTKNQEAKTKSKRRACKPNKRRKIDKKEMISKFSKT